MNANLLQQEITAMQAQLHWVSALQPRGFPIQLDLAESIELIFAGKVRGGLL